MKFSVIIPVFNSKKYLMPCLQSVVMAAANYRGGRVEIICVDNGSTDGSWEMLADLEPIVKRARLVKVSVASMRNQGAAISRGKMLCFLDSDCLMGVDYFAAAEKALNQYDASGSKHVLPEGANWIERTWYEIHARRQDGPVNYVNSGNFVINRQVFQSEGGFDINFRTCEDVEFCQRLRREGFTLYESHAVKAVHLGGDKDLKTFFRKNVWRGAGLRNLGKAGRLVKAMAVNHAFYVLLAAVVMLANVSLGWRIAVAVALTNLVPFGAVCYRAWQTRRFYHPIQAMFLYNLFLSARFWAICEAR
jgi:glycosyltransferase involved in cell wall biosynthesis